jgi:hypothetical protein
MFVMRNVLSLLVCVLFFGGLNTLHAINFGQISFDDSVFLFGTPSKITDTKGYKNVHWEEQTLTMTFFEEKAFHWASRSPLILSTEKGVRVGDDLKAVIKQYGDHSKKVISKKWFEGDKKNVLYYHPGNRHYKVVLPQEKTYLLLDKNKIVVSITINMTS